MLTGIYLGLGALVLFDRWEEIGTLFAAPTIDTKRLPLNSIGDILAGFFAPLAFLWLFVATQLQRKELRLQREELADTRKVLAQQQVELEKTAAENNRQTEIMRRTLDSAQSREMYDAFSLDLYFHARRCLADGDYTFEIRAPSGVVHARLNAVPHGYSLSQSDLATVDNFYEKFALNVKNLANNYSGGAVNENDPTNGPIILSALESIDFIESLQAVRDSTDNELIKGRFDSLRLKELRNNLSQIFKIDSRSRAKELRMKFS